MASADSLEIAFQGRVLMILKYKYSLVKPAIAKADVCLDSSEPPCKNAYLSSTLMKPLPTTRTLPCYCPISSLYSQPVYT